MREPLRLAHRALNVYTSQGPVALLRRIGPRVRAYLVYPKEVVLWRSKTFGYQNRQFHYVIHPNGETWLNERSVELALAKEFLSGQSRVLEVGNVLAHYGAISHDVVDKYEKAPGVLNVDVVDYVPAAPYDQIISISTIEHVGWDEDVRAPDKTIMAIQHLRRCLTPGGRMLVTCPLGYNAFLDEHIFNGRLQPRTQAFIRRVGKRWWSEVPGEELIDVSYDSDGRVLWVGEFCGEPSIPPNADP